MSKSLVVAVITLTILLALSLSFSVSDFITLTQGRVTFYLGWVSDGLIIVYMLLSIAVVTVAKFCASVARPGDLQISRVSGNVWRPWLRSKVILIGLVLLGIASLCMDSIGVGADAKCIGVITTACHSAEVRATRYLELVRRIVRICFVLAAFGFSCRFIRVQRVVKPTLMLVTLALTGATIVSVWINILLDESLSPSALLNATKVELLRCSPSRERAPDLLVCLGKLTELHGMLADCSPYLYPCFVEYLIIVTGVVVWWLKRVAHNQALASVSESAIHQSDDDGNRFLITHDETPSSSVAVGTADNSIQRDADLAAGSATEESMKRREAATSPLLQVQQVECEVEGEETPLLATRSRETQSRPVIEIPVGFYWNAITSRCPNTFPLKLMAGLFWIAINAIGLSLSIAAVAAVNDDNYLLYYEDFVRYLIFYWSLLLLFMLAGLLLSLRVARNSLNTPLEHLVGGTISFDYVFAICLLGPLIYSTFATVIIAKDGDPSQNAFHQLIAAEALSIAQVILQTVFYFFAKHVAVEARETAHSDRETELEQRSGGRIRGALKSVLIAVIVSNFVLWAESSFVEIYPSVSMIPMKFYAEWPYIYNTVKPLAITYRFLSFSMFFDVYLQL